MKLITFFEGVFFSCLYSLPPFLLYDSFSGPFYGFKYEEPNILKEYRYYVLISMSFLLFVLYSEFTFRTRYVLWHLEKNRYASGFTPIETLITGIYFAFYLCGGSEIVLYIWAPLSNKIETPPNSFLLTRITNIFFLGIIENIFLECSGYFDRLRRFYFDVER